MPRPFLCAGIFVQRRPKAASMSAQRECFGQRKRFLIARSRIVPNARGEFRRGFTFVESVIAMSVLALAGAALLTSVASALSSCNESIFSSVGRGLAEQMLDEIAASKFPNGNSPVVSTTTVRTAFSTIDDYSDWSESPLRTKSGQLLGSDQTLASGTPDTSGLSMATLPSESQRSKELQASASFMARFTRTVKVERIEPNGAGWNVVTQHTPYRRVTVTVSYAASADTQRPVAELVRVFAAISGSL